MDEREHSDGFGTVTQQLKDWAQIDPDRVVDRAVARKASWLAAALAGWGVFSGFAIFLNVQEETTKVRHGHSLFFQFMGPLLFASAVALVSEVLREIIKEGDEEREEHGEVPQPGSRFGFAPKLIVSVFMLALFEFFISAWHGVAESSMGGELVPKIMETVLPGMRGRSPGFGLLTAMVLLWVVSGALLVWFLARMVFRMLGKQGSRASNGMWIGAVAGGVVAPAVVFAYILVTQFSRGVHLFLTNHQQWSMTARALDEQYKHSSFPLASVAFGTPAMFDDLWLHVRFGPVITVVVVALLIALFWRFRQIRFMGWLMLFGCFAVFAAPLFATGASRIYMIPLLAGVIWLVPGAILGALAPRLRRPSMSPRTWGSISFAVAGLLILLRLLQLADQGFLYPAFALIGSGILLIRSKQVQDYWPLVALSVAMLICGTTLIQQATFFNVLERLYGVLDTPPFLTTDLIASTTKSIEYILRTGEVNELRRKVRATESLKAEEQREKLKELREEVNAQAIVELDLAWREAYWPNEAGRSPFRAAIEKHEPDLVAPLMALSHESPGHYREAVSDLQQKVRGRLARMPKAANLSVSPRFSEGVHSETAGLLADAANNMAAAGFTLNPGAFGLGPSPSVSNLPKAEPPVEDAYAGDKPGQWHCGGGTRSAECALVKLDFALGERLADFDAVTVSRQIPEHLNVVITGNTLDAHSGLEATPGANLTALMALDNEIDELDKRAEERRAWDAQHVGQHLELALAGSLGFWTTVGFLAGWSLLRRQNLVLVEDGHARCFWAKREQRGYHDQLHGTKVSSDAELFSRLALAISGMDQSPLAMNFYRDVLVPLRAETVAKWDDPARIKYFREARVPLRDSQITKLAGLPAIAKQFVKFEAGGDAAAVIAEINAQPGLGDKIGWLQSELGIALDFPAGGFLQSVGLLPEAHVAHCEWNRSPDQAQATAH